MSLFDRADRVFTTAGAASAGLAVAAGAFGAHALHGKISPERLDVFDVAVRYHLFHSLGLFAVAWVVSRSTSRAARVSGFLLLGGIVLFSGSLYALALTDEHAFGAVTPFGGVTLLVGWGLLALATRRAWSGAR